MLIIALLIFKTLTGVQGGCPSRCNCTENSITCIEKNLQCVPYFDSLTNSPLIIDLSGNQISFIDNNDFSFEQSDQVIEIFLNSSSLTGFGDEAFSELENLQDLYLGDNLLHSLPENFIVNNENMVFLDLSSNYFDEMPKIRSTSLEVLAIANSGVTTISNDALDGLTNLRILLLQQNNLKSINPVVFTKMSNLFFVRLAYNPWKCDCSTIELFEFLTSKKFVEITEPVQCQNDSQVFIEIYNNGFKKDCTDFGDNDPKPVPKIQEKVVDESNTDKKIIITEEIDFDTNFYYCLILFCAIILSLVVGAACGSCITYRFMTSTMKMTESKKELLQDIYT